MARIVTKKRHSIRKSQLTSLYTQLDEEIGESALLFHSDRVEVVETDREGLSLFLVDKKPFIMDYRDHVFPTLRGALAYPFPQRRVTVDSGAVSFVVNGADVMRPGIVDISDDVMAGHPVVIVEERHKKPIALGIAQMDAGEMKQKTSGKVIKNIHYVGDDIWNIEF
ncbi:MAG TPA: RNA-binding protein [Methanoregulaceae archaeon]|nr:RNA-binding protein [Methanoregulaceae archaeon]